MTAKILRSFGDGAPKKWPLRGKPPIYRLPFWPCHPTASYLSPEGAEHSSPGLSGAATAAKRRPGLANQGTPSPERAKQPWINPPGSVGICFALSGLDRYFRFVIPGRRYALPWANMLRPLRASRNAQWNLRKIDNILSIFGGKCLTLFFRNSAKGYQLPTLSMWTRKGYFCGKAEKL